MSQAIREYKDSKAFRRGAGRMASEGWDVALTTSLNARSGCLRFFLLGPLALIFRPRDRIVVTYKRHD